MPRRPSVQRPTTPYRYMTTAGERAIDICETSDETGRVHRVRPDVWPPKKKRGMRTEDDPESLRCEYCGSVVLVYADNDPEMSGIEVIVPEKRQKVTA